MWNLTLDKTKPSVRTGAESGGSFRKEGRAVEG